MAYKLGQQSIILRVKLSDSSKGNNTGILNISNTTTGLVIATIADNESSATVYSQVSATIENITTVGSYVTPTSGKCRFRQCDAVLLPGLYEIQLDNARYAVSDAKSLIIMIHAIDPFNVAQMDCVIPLWKDDPYLSKPINFNNMDIDGSGHLNLQPTALDLIVKDSYSATQAIFLSAAGILGELSGLPASPATIKSLDGANTRAVIAFDANSNRLSSIITPP